jgi:hypothetical protein
MSPSRKIPASSRALAIVSRRFHASLARSTSEPTAWHTIGSIGSEERHGLREFRRQVAPDFLDNCLGKHE